MIQKKQEYEKWLPKCVYQALLYGHETVSTLFGEEVTEQDVLEMLSECKPLFFIPE